MTEEEHSKYFVKPFTRNILEPLNPKLYFYNFKVFTRTPWWRNVKEFYDFPKSRRRVRGHYVKVRAPKQRIYFYRDHAFFLKVLELYYTLLVEHGEKEFFVLVKNQLYLLYYDHASTIPCFSDKGEALKSLYKSIMQIKYYSDRRLYGYEAVHFFFSSKLESDLIHFFERAFRFDLQHKEFLPYTRATMQLKLSQDA